MVEINKPSCRVTSCNFMLPHLEPLPLSSPSLALSSLPWAVVMAGSVRGTMVVMVVHVVCLFENKH